MPEPLVVSIELTISSSFKGSKVYDLTASDTLRPPAHRAGFVLSRLGIARDRSLPQALTKFFSRRRHLTLCGAGDADGRQFRRSGDGAVKQTLVAAPSRHCSFSGQPMHIKAVGGNTRDQ
jgi:hypothetical protein